MPRTRTLIAAAVAVPLALTAALAADPPPDPAPGRQLCRGATKTVSSRIRTPRRCRTAEAWRAEDEKTNRLPLGAQVTQGQNDGRAPVQPR